MAPSISIFPGPVSKACTSPSSPPAGRTVTLLIPPMLWTMRERCASPNNTKCTYGARGAPSPPAAMSRGRKSATVMTPVRSAMTLGSPSCNVAPMRMATQQEQARAGVEPFGHENR